MKKSEAIAFISILALTLFIVGSAWAESHHDNIAWQKAQLQEKFNNINIETVSTYEKQMEKIKRTQDYLKAWGWRE